MAKRSVAKARQSQLVGTYGIGSLIPAGDQSFMVCGMDDWRTWDEHVIDEPRLARSMGVSEFRMPPSGGSKGDVPVIRFPLMHHCPVCRRLGTPRDLSGSWEKIECDRDHKALIPSRFVACCDRGHIEDFPYRRWVHAGQDGEGDDHRLQLKTSGRSSSLADIEISCSCGVRPVSMAGSFESRALVKLAKCRGKRPWLVGAPDEECDRPLRTLQRGSSNVWFGILRSAISIPPWTSASARFVEKNRGLFELLSDEAVKEAATNAATKRHDLDAALIIDIVLRSRTIATDTPPTEADLRRDEFQALREPAQTDNFVCEDMQVNAHIRQVVKQVSQVGRLREVRALEGFSRVYPAQPGGTTPATLSYSAPEWLPAIEVRGEGVFLQIEPKLVTEWAERSGVRSRHAAIEKSQEERDLRLKIVSDPVSATFVVLHTLAHLLLKELSLHAGYPVSALRERIYADEAQTGILIYTASSDAAGSLGGLAALAEAEVFGDIFIQAMERARWCSSDPVCAESGVSGPDGLNLSACHACALLPETSCEHLNQFLDRVMVVGTPDDGALGLVASRTDDRS